MKKRIFKLIKEFPFSPSIGTKVVFETESHFNDGIYNVGAISNLLLDDCTSYPEYWRDVSYGDIEEGVDKIFKNSTWQANYSNTDWDGELDISVCKIKIVKYIKQLLNEN